ncbi:MAG: nucleotidyltransferase family protein [Betaproteobacteria bacterium]|jgi:MurNAc alpha-1-phosphate uridylyltransferase
MIRHALILAAGRGERMRPLTDHTPKPLLQVRGRRLIEWHLQALANAGVREVVVNTAWLEEQFEPALGDGSHWGVRLHWSREGRDHGGALETAGGIAKALPRLGEAFWVVSGDVFLPGFRFDAGPAQAVLDTTHLGHLWMVPNGAHHPRGDFSLGDDGVLGMHESLPRLTWASVGVFHRSMFEDLHAGERLPLRPLLESAIAQGRLGGTRWAGAWADVGTPERLTRLQDLSPPAPS